MGFANDGQETILQGAGPDDGHCKIKSSYKSKLDGLMDVLDVIYRYVISMRLLKEKFDIFWITMGSLLVRSYQ